MICYLKAFICISERLLSLAFGIGTHLSFVIAAHIRFEVVLFSRRITGYWLKFLFVVCKLEDVDEWNTP